MRIIYLLAVALLLISRITHASNSIEAIVFDKAGCINAGCQYRMYVFHDDTYLRHSYSMVLVSLKSTPENDNYPDQVDVIEKGSLPKGEYRRLRKTLAALYETQDSKVEHNIVYVCTDTASFTVRLVEIDGYRELHTLRDCPNENPSILRLFDNVEKLLQKNE